LLEWLQVDPKVTSCKILYSQAGVQDSLIMPVSANKDTVRVLIPGLEETNYTFKIITYDDFGHVSIPVETEESVYGAMYEQSLVNRAIKTSIYDVDNGLYLEWYGPDGSEIATKLNYTDVAGNSRTLLLDKSETVTSIPDFKVSEPLAYSTMYKPVPTAIDTFYAPTAEKRIPYWREITSQVLVNTQQPFAKGAMVFGGRYFAVTGWTANATAAANGNVDSGQGDLLTMWLWPGVSPSPNIVNGKIYQTVELEAGTYRFNAYSLGCYSSGFSVYVVAALGNDLPDVADAENALGYAVVPSGIASGTILSFEFTLTEKSTVSLGFVGNLNDQQQVYFGKVELWSKQ